MVVVAVVGLHLCTNVESRKVKMFFLKDQASNVNVFSKAS